MNCPKRQSTQIIKYRPIPITANHDSDVRTADDSLLRMATRQPIDEATRQLIDKLLLDGAGMSPIARVTGVSERWLQMYVNQKFYQAPKTIDITPKKQVG